MKTKLQIELISKWLMTSPETRDNDNYLCALIWHDEAKEKGLLNDALSFLMAYSRGGFTPAETITRSRRRAQELYPELRGIKYNHRKEAGKNFKP
jgi:hypothetical protein